MSCNCVNCPLFVAIICMSVTVFKLKRPRSCGQFSRNTLPFLESAQPQATRIPNDISFYYLLCWCNSYPVIASFFLLMENRFFHSLSCRPVCRHVFLITTWSAEPFQIARRSISLRCCVETLFTLESILGCYRWNFTLFPVISKSVIRLSKRPLHVF